MLIKDYFDALSNGFEKIDQDTLTEAFAINRLQECLLKRIEDDDQRFLVSTLLAQPLVTEPITCIGNMKENKE